MAKIESRRWNHTYTEVDFCACLLVHGWDHNDFTSGYWAEVDKWFAQQWPDRYDEFYEVSVPYVHKNPNYEGQMEFKMQFFGWIREIHHVASYKTRPDREIPRKAHPKNRPPHNPLTYTAV